MNKKIKSPSAITAYAIIKKKSMKLKAYDIFPDKEVKATEDELLIKVKIVPYENIKK